MNSQHEMSALPTPDAVLLDEPGSDATDEAPTPRLDLESAARLAMAWSPQEG